jgi:hypothetical protein
LLFGQQSDSSPFYGFGDYNAPQNLDKNKGGKAYLCKKMEEMGRKSKYDSRRKEFMEKSGIVFEYKETESKEIKALRSERDRLLKKVGQLTVEVDFFAEACERAGLKKK